MLQLKVVECQLVISAEFALRRSVFRKQLIESNFLKYVDTQNLQYSAQTFVNPVSLIETGNHEVNTDS